MDKDIELGILKLLGHAATEAQLELVATLLEPYKEIPYSIWLALAPQSSNLVERCFEICPADFVALVKQLRVIPAKPWSPVQLYWWDKKTAIFEPLKSSLVTYQAVWQKVVDQSEYHTQVLKHLVAGLWNMHRIAFPLSVWQGLLDASDMDAGFLYYYAQYAHREGHLETAKHYYNRYLEHCPAHFPTPALVADSMQPDRWYATPNSTEAWAALAQIEARQTQNHLEVQRLFLHAIGIAPDYYKAPYWVYAQYLEGREGPSAYTTLLKQRHLKVVKLDFWRKPYALPHVMIYKRALEVAEATWQYCKDEASAKNYYVLAQGYLDARRRPKQVKRLFYSLLKRQCYDIILHLYQTKPTLSTDYKVSAQRNVFTAISLDRAYRYFAAKALEKKIEQLLETHRDYWQAQRLVKRWIELQPESNKAQALAQTIRAALPY